MQHSCYAILHCTKQSCIPGASCAAVSSSRCHVSKPPLKPRARARHAQDTHKTRARTAARAHEHTKASARQTHEGKCTHMCARMHAHVHTHSRTHMCTRTHARTCAHARTHAHVHTHARTHMCTHTHARTCAHARTHTRTPCAHARMHMCTRTRMQRHKGRHNRAQPDARTCAHSLSFFFFRAGECDAMCLTERCVHLTKGQLHLTCSKMGIRRGMLWLATLSIAVYTASSRAELAARCPL